MQPTRQRILDYLSQRGSASARQLAFAFRMTPANLRRHLGILLGDDLVRETSLQKAGGRGRPHRRFTLGDQAKRNNLASLSGALLSELTKGSMLIADEKLMALARRLLGALLKPSGQISQRLVTAVQRLAPMGYKPHWEARPQTPEVVFGHCPYAAIINDHPELCKMDAYMLEELLGAQVEQTAKLQTGPQGVPICVFRVTPSSNR